MSTINTILIKRRLESSLNTGLPTLSGGELAFSEKNHTLYYGGEYGTLEIAGSGAFVDISNAQTITAPKTFTELTTLSSVTFSSDSTIDLGSNLITNLAEPASSSDAATKNYVDIAASGASSSTNALSSEIYGYFVEKYETDAVELVGGLTVTSGITADNIHTTGDLLVTGDLTVLGDFSKLNTETTVTSAFSVVNTGSTTALTVEQTGSTDIAEFKDDGATALIIKDGGNVGIGTDAPNETLTVSGNISATGSIYSDGGVEISSGGGATTLYVEDGLVGINTETPNEALTVVGSISASVDIFARNGDFTGTMDIDGATTLGSTLDVTGATTFASTVSAQGAVTVDGATVVNNTLNVTGAVDFDSTLNVDGTSTFVGDISASADIVGVAGTSNIIGFIIDGGSF